MKEDLPKEVSRGIVNIGGIEVEVIVLDNGQRLFTEEGFAKLTEFLTPPKTNPPLTISE